MSFHKFTTGKEEQGSFEVFKIEPDMQFSNGEEALAPGWYWWACFPGCTPDGEPEGPFKTYVEAYNHAQNF